jgi:Ca2+-transporting ATPase
VTTVRLGRRIYDNLRKAMAYTVAVHIPIAGLAILPLALGLPLILTPIHIAFLEMVIDPACSIVFEAEPEEDDVMRRPPRDPSASLLPRQLVLWSLLQGVAALLVTTAVLFLGRSLHLPEPDLRSLAFTTLVGVNVALIFVNRSFDGSLISELSRKNRSLWVLLTGIAVVLGLAVFSEGGRELFHFGPMHLDDLSISAALGLGMLGALNIIKRKWRAAYK